MATMKLGSKPEAFQLEGQTWVCQNELASDIVIEIGEMSFHLHKFPLLNRSGLLKRMISDLYSEDGQDRILQLDDIPGGAKSFELVAKFCYDVKIELNALNIVCLRCAAEHLRMTEDYVGGNLIVQTENFLNEIFGNWKDSIKALETCEDVLPQAEELHIVARCINSLATKACADPTIFGWPMSGCNSMKNPEDGVLWNGICLVEKPRSDWWYEDVSFLSLPLYKRLILAMETKGMKPENIAGSLTFYAMRYLPGLNRNSSFRDGTSRINSGVSVSAPSERDQRGLLEELVGLLPAKKGVTSTKFLLRLLRTTIILHASPSCSEILERRVGAQLDEAALEDLLIPNLGYSVETLYDIDCIQRILDHFMLICQTTSVEASPAIVDEEGQLMGGCSPSPRPMNLVAKLMDGYLAEVAPDINLKLPKFQSLAATIPDYARPLDDGIYRAIDIYLKSHPWLTETEREHLCRLMNCQKLSLEACTHAAQNERLPLRVVVQVLFFEQLRLRTSIAGWFFVSDNNNNMDNNSHHGPPPTDKNLMLPKNNNDDDDGDGDGDEIIQTEIVALKKEKKSLCVEEMKLRVAQLEKECSRMKREIEKLGGPPQPKSGWNVFSKKFGFGVKSHTSSKANK